MCVIVHGRRHCRGSQENLPVHSCFHSYLSNTVCNSQWKRFLVIRVRTNTLGEMMTFRLLIDQSACDHSIQPITGLKKRRHGLHKKYTAPPSLHVLLHFIEFRLTPYLVRFLDKPVSLSFLFLCWLDTRKASCVKCTVCLLINYLWESRGGSWPGSAPHTRLFYPRNLVVKVMTQQYSRPGSETSTK